MKLIYVHYVLIFIAVVLSYTYNNGFKVIPLLAAIILPEVYIVYMIYTRGLNFKQIAPLMSMSPPQGTPSLNIK